MIHCELLNVQSKCCLWCWLCTAGGRRVFILHIAVWLYSIRRGTKCVVINFLLAHTKLAIWFTRTNNVCGSGPIDPLHCSFFGPSGPKMSYMWVKDSHILCMIEYANMDYIKIYFMHIQECSVLNCLYLGNIWGICDLSVFSDIFSLCPF